MVVATAAEVAAIAGAQASRRHADSTNGEGDPTVQGMLADKVLLEQRLAACATFSDRDQPSENAGELVATRRAATKPFLARAPVCFVWRTVDEINHTGAKQASNTKNLILFSARNG